MGSLSTRRSLSGRVSGSCDEIEPCVDALADQQQQVHRRWWHGMKRQLHKYVSTFNVEGEEDLHPARLPPSKGRPALETRPSGPLPQQKGHLPAGGLLIVTTPDGELKISAVGVFAEERALKKAQEVLVGTFDVLSSRRRVQHQMMAAVMKRGKQRMRASQSPASPNATSSSREGSLGTASGSSGASETARVS